MYRRSRPILPCSKYNVLSDSKSVSAYSMSGFASALIGVHAHLGQINTESWFEERLLCLREELTTTLEGCNAMLEVGRYDRLGAQRFGLLF